MLGLPSLDHDALDLIEAHVVAAAVVKLYHSSLAHVAWNQDGLLYTYDAYKRRFNRP
jgi:hypothetical protein